MLKEIKYKNRVFGYIIKYKKKKGVNFLTPPKLTHQVASIVHKKHHVIKAHLHFRNIRKE